MNMRHERILLVVLGYVIGFVTAYIAFVVPAAVPVEEADLPSSRGSVQQKQEKDFKVEMNTIGMFAVNGDSKSLISATLTNGTPPGPGFHVEVPEYAPSPNNKFVYFCARLTIDETYCHHYLYLVGRHIIKPLRADGVLLTSAIFDADFEWTPDGSLVSDNLKSVSPDAPWNLSID